VIGEMIRPRCRRRGQWGWWNLNCGIDPKATQTHFRRELNGREHSLRVAMLQLAVPWPPRELGVQVGEVTVSLNDFIWRRP